MGLVVCLACGSQKQITPLKLGKYRCSHCGAGEPRLIRGRAEKVWMGGEKDGCDVETARHQTYAGLVWLAEQRGYKKPRGWAAHKFRAIFGRWPNGEANEAGSAPSSGLLRWDKKQRALYAKEQREIEKRNGLAANHSDMGGADGIPPTVVDSGLMTDEDWQVKW